MILTAGKGTRLLPLSKKVPKPLFPVGDRPVIFYLLSLLREYGVKTITLNLHHLGSEIEQWLGDGKRLGLQVRYSREEQLLGTGGGIKNASSLWGGGQALVCNGDNLLELKLDKLFQYHRARQTAATMVLRPRRADSPYTPIYLDSNGLVRYIGGRHHPPAYAFLGTQVISPEFLGILPRSGPAELIKDGYRRVLRSRGEVGAVISTTYWKEISTWRSYWEVNQDFLRGKSPSYFYRGREEFTRRGIYAGKRCSLGPRVKFYPSVYLSEESRIGEGCILGPLVLVGRGCRIGADCRLENVILWPGCTVRKGSRLKNVIVTPFGKVKLDV